MNAVPVTQKHVVLSDGFELDVKIDTQGDMELLEDIVDLGDGDPVAMVKVFRRFLPPEEKARLWEHLRDKAGVVQVAKAMETLQEIFGKLQDETTKK